MFDQRGCGKSTPHASLEDNTTRLNVAFLKWPSHMKKLSYSGEAN